MNSIPVSAPTSRPRTLVDALRIVGQNPPATAPLTFKAALVCGFTPLHLQTFLTAELRLIYPAHHIETTTGLHDDIPGTLKGLSEASVDAIVIAVEWADIDPRLGLRRLGGWSPQQSASIIERAHTWLAHIGELVEAVAEKSPVVISLPTLPLPPCFFTPGWQAAIDELRVRTCVANFGANVAQVARVKIISEQALAALSPPAERLSVKSTWISGFPYRTAHSAHLAELMGRAVADRLPKKGLITDLDNTLWSGIVGDDGVENISWDLDHKSQAHGVYQQLLSSLAEEGVLVAVVSKNDSAVVDAAFARGDLLLPKKKVFPIAVSWSSKAQGVARVLDTWNVHADSVVFVDDNPMELAEVQAAYPGMECVLFPRHDSQGAYELFVHLRDVFGRSAVSYEDALRLESLRSRATAKAALEDGDGYSDAVLAQAEPELTIDFRKNTGDTRALELVNKTNQFNLSGKRSTEREWIDFLQRDATFLLTASYNDRFGPLGKIAVLAGHVNGSRVHIETWVMSCRAFGRRIEHQCLKAVFERFQADRISFEYHETHRNGPMTRFLTEVLDGTPSTSTIVTAARFDAMRPPLFHRVVVRDGLGDERYAGASR